MIGLLYLDTTSSIHAGNNLDGGVATDSSGNVYVTGNSWGPGGGRDYGTIKYNSNGVQQWASRYNGPANGDDVAYAIAVDSSGNVYVTGSSLGSGSGLDYATVKYNSSGVQQWVMRYNGPANGDDIAYAITVDSWGDVYVTGSSLGPGVGLDYATVKYDSNGAQQWAVRYNGPANSNDIAVAVAVDNCANVYVTGSSLGLGVGLDYATVKYNSNGAQQWAARYNGPVSSEDIAYAIAVDSWGNAYVTGSSLGLGSGLDYATVKYNSNGMQQWASRYNGPANINDIAYAIAIDTGGNAYVTGSSLGSGVGLDYATVKYNCNGAQQWVARYNGPANHDDIAYAIGMDSLGNVYVTGSSFGPGSGLDYATIKYNCNGARKWVGRFNGPANGDDKANAIVIDSSNNVFVTGSSLGLGTGLDYATLKYNCNGARQWASRFNGPASGDDIADGLRSEMNHKFARWNQAIRKCEVAGL